MIFFQQLEDWLQSNTKLPLPKCEGDDTIFEYMVNEKGGWEHWSGRVSLYIYILYIIFWWFRREISWNDKGEWLGM